MSSTHNSDNTTTMSSSCSSSSNHRDKKQVSFGRVLVRYYNMTLGVNPSCSIGAPVSLDWDFHEDSPVQVDEFEDSKNDTGINGKRRIRAKPMQFYLSYYRRKEILESAGFGEEEFNSAERRVKFDRFKRNLSYYQCYPINKKNDFKTSMGRRKNKRFVKRYRRQQKKEEQKKLKMQQTQQKQQQKKSPKMMRQ